MPNIEENKRVWSKYSWGEAGDEWSKFWGSTHYLWLCSLLPRIESLIPCKSILEIAPGYGRCSQYLKEYCEELYLVDITEKCIEFCKHRFKEDSHINYFVNDGKSLDMVNDESLDLIFSWDSLVHVDVSIIEVYIQQISKKLKSNGYAFIHHSNLNEYYDKEGRLNVVNKHWRDESVSATVFASLCEEYDMICISQEKIAWGGDILNDCISVFTRRSNASIDEIKIFENKNFMQEARRASTLNDMYYIKNKR